jgi:hypothetical protein
MRTKLDKLYASALNQSSRNNIMKAVIGAMQGAEEIGGPEGEEYIQLMKDISNEALRRAAAFKKQTPSTLGWKKQRDDARAAADARMEAVDKARFRRS